MLRIAASQNLFQQPAKHGFWLNLVENFFSKFARSVLRHIRVASKLELKERIMAGSRTLIGIPSSIHGPTSWPRSPDMIRLTETLISLSPTFNHLVFEVILMTLEPT